jgi:hypothetical protein
MFATSAIGTITTWVAREGLSPGSPLDTKYALRRLAAFVAALNSNAITKTVGLPR